MISGFNPASIFSDNLRSNYGYGHRALSLCLPFSLSSGLELFVYFSKRGCSLTKYSRSILPIFTQLLFFSEHFLDSYSEICLLLFSLGTPGFFFFASYYHYTLWSSITHYFYVTFFYLFFFPLSKAPCSTCICPDTVGISIIIYLSLFLILWADIVSYHPIPEILYFCVAVLNTFSVCLKSFSQFSSVPRFLYERESIFNLIFVAFWLCVCYNIVVF